MNGLGCILLVILCDGVVGRWASKGGDVLTGLESNSEPNVSEPISLLQKDVRAQLGYPFNRVIGEDLLKDRRIVPKCIIVFGAIFVVGFLFYILLPVVSKFLCTESTASPLASVCGTVVVNHVDQFISMTSIAKGPCFKAKKLAKDDQFTKHQKHCIQLQYNPMWAVHKHPFRAESALDMGYLLRLEALREDSSVAGVALVPLPTLSKKPKVFEVDCSQGSARKETLVYRVSARNVDGKNCAGEQGNANCKREQTWQPGSHSQITVMVKENVESPATTKGFNNEKNILICTISFLTLYLFVGTLFYNQVEKWSVLSSLYFCVGTMVTTGFGDLAPTSIASKIFTSTYSILGVTFIACLIGITQCNMIFSELISLKKNTTGRTAWDLGRHIGKWFLVQAMTMMTLVFYFAEVEGLPYVDAAYFVVTTAVHVGYGDIHMESDGGIAVVTLSMCMEVLVVANIMSGLIRFYVSHRVKSVYLNASVLLSSQVSIVKAIEEPFCKDRGFLDDFDDSENLHSPHLEGSEKLHSHHQEVSELSPSAEDMVFTNTPMTVSDTHVLA